MVRINLINPKFLTDEHLNAEYVEIKMLVRYILKYPNGEIPKNYTLNNGHMKFFRDKGCFIINRFGLVLGEMIKRRINIDRKNVFDMAQLFIQIPNNNKRDYFPTKEAININLKRIYERIENPLRKKTPYHYYKTEITLSKYNDIAKFEIFEVY